MRNLRTGSVFGVLVLILLSAANAQTAPPQGDVGSKPIEKDAGAPPRQDLAGVWGGPVEGQEGPVPLMTALGKEQFSHNKSERVYNVAGTNDLYVKDCNPMGFPYNSVYETRGLAFASMPGHVIILHQMQRIWRDVWMDGRQLPKNVGGTDKDSPDPRYYGYSVGHWDGDNTLVIETTGLDEKTWLDYRGYPHTVDAHIEERYSRVDHDHLKLVITVDDPKFYTKPFVLGTVNFKWLPSQELDEQLCIPSDIAEYMKSMGNFEK